jgi:hypothetical protein
MSNHNVNVEKGRQGFQTRTKNEATTAAFPTLSFEDDNKEVATSFTEGRKEGLLRKGAIRRFSHSPQVQVGSYRGHPATFNITLVQHMDGGFDGYMNSALDNDELREGSRDASAEDFNDVRYLQDVFERVANTDEEHITPDEAEFIVGFLRRHRSDFTEADDEFYYNR